MKVLKLLLITFVLFNILKIAAAKENSKKAYIRSLIIEYAKQTNYVKPSLALAVAQVESNFNANAVSSKGAIGVMQIMPRTALYEFGVAKKSLFNPKTNIKIGIKFLDQLIIKYNGRIDIALSHYNGGSAVGKWPNVRIIPATYNYVVKVLKISNKYKFNAILNNQRKVYLKNKRNDFSKITKFDKNLQEIDKWLKIYKDLKKDIIKSGKFDKT